jgi:hypothetical protein
MLKTVAVVFWYQRVFKRIFLIKYDNLSVNHSTGSMIEVIKMHKKDVLSAGHLRFNAMEGLHYTSRDISV